MVQISTRAPAGGATRKGANTESLGQNFYSRPCGRGDQLNVLSKFLFDNFYSRPCGRGDLQVLDVLTDTEPISTHAPAGGATKLGVPTFFQKNYFYSRPCGRGDGYSDIRTAGSYAYFYSRPCGRGDIKRGAGNAPPFSISTHAPAGGATELLVLPIPLILNFYSRPCGRGDAKARCEAYAEEHFYSRPCGRGDALALSYKVSTRVLFLLTPLREGRPLVMQWELQLSSYFYSRPCGRGDGL